MTKSTHDQDRPGKNNESPDKRNSPGKPAPDEIGRAHQSTNPVKEARERGRLQVLEENWRRGDGKPSQRDA